MENRIQRPGGLQMNFWVVKANSNPEHGGFGWHWRYYLQGRSDAGRKWGGPEWINHPGSKKHIRQNVKKGDLVLCYQTNERSILGLTCMATDGEDESPGSGDFNMLNFVPPRQALLLEAPGLRITDLRDRGCDPDCFGNKGGRGTICPLRRSDFAATIRTINDLSLVPRREVLSWLRRAGYSKAVLKKRESHITSVTIPDDDESPPRRFIWVSERVVRNTAKGEKLKRLYACKCQVCGRRILVPGGLSRAYAEIHHLRPLGRDHGGMDNWDNMLVLCPNCHVEFDVLAMAIDPGTRRIVCYNPRNENAGKKLRVRSEHSLAADNLEYHWRRFSEVLAD
jgi:5-methylcytosine-specific restriction endonuclease McrA